MAAITANPIASTWGALSISRAGSCSAGGVCVPCLIALAFVDVVVAICVPGLCVKGALASTKDGATLSESFDSGTSSCCTQIIFLRSTVSNANLSQAREGVCEVRGTAEMASVGVTAHYTTVAWHAVATKARAQKHRNRRVRRGAAGPGWRGGPAPEPWRPAWRLETCSALAAMARACPNWSRSTRAVSAVSCARPLFWIGQRMRSWRGACSSKATRRFDAGKRC